MRCCFGSCEGCGDLPSPFCIQLTEIHQTAQSACTKAFGHCQMVLVAGTTSTRGRSSRSSKPSSWSQTGRMRPMSGSPPLARQLRMTCSTNSSNSGDLGASRQEAYSKYSCSTKTAPGASAAFTRSSRSRGCCMKVRIQRAQAPLAPVAGSGAASRSSSCVCTCCNPRRAHSASRTSRKRRERSSASTRPVGPTIAARSSVAQPGPQPMSSSVWPAEKPARRQASSTRGCHTWCCSPKRPISSSCVPST